MNINFCDNLYAGKAKQTVCGKKALLLYFSGTVGVKLFRDH